MSKIHCRTVTPMSLLIDVFVELERLQRSLVAVRDDLVEESNWVPMELYDAQRHCRNINEELRTIKSLLRLKAQPKPAPQRPQGPPDLKLIG